MKYILLLFLLGLLWFGFRVYSFMNRVKRAAEERNRATGGSDDFFGQSGQSSYPGGSRGKDPGEIDISDRVTILDEKQSPKT